MRLGMNHPMGPLALADLIGLAPACSSCRPCSTVSATANTVLPVAGENGGSRQVGPQNGEGFYKY
jgi:3-hydroxyacyl-CoA dehydrogenase